MIQYIYSASSAPLLYDPRDSRYYFPELPSGFSNNTIYKAFIVFCKDKSLNLNSELVEACGLSNVDSDENITIEQKIELMKADGIRYTDELFQQLLTIVNLKNKITIDTTYKIPNKVQQFNETLIKYKDTTDTIIPLELINDLIELLDRYSLKQETASSTSRKIKNFLDIENTKLYDKIILFIKSNSSLSKSKLSNLSNCINNITEFLEIGDNITSTSNDSTTFKAIGFIKNVLKTIINLLPNIVMNKINYQDTKIPKHWNLSSRHQADIKEMINSYYKNLKPLYEQEDLNSVLELIQNKCASIVEFSLYTPFFSSILLKDKSIDSIFDSRLVLLLYKFYFLKTIEYRTLKSDLSLLAYLNC